MATWSPKLSSFMAVSAMKCWDLGHRKEKQRWIHPLKSCSIVSEDIVLLK